MKSRIVAAVLAGFDRVSRVKFRRSTCLACLVVVVMAAAVARPRAAVTRPDLRLRQWLWPSRCCRERCCRERCHRNRCCNNSCGCAAPSCALRLVPPRLAPPQPPAAPLLLLAVASKLAAATMAAAVAIVSAAAVSRAAAVSVAARPVAIVAAAATTPAVAMPPRPAAAAPSFAKTLAPATAYSAAARLSDESNRTSLGRDRTRSGLLLSRRSGVCRRGTLSDDRSAAQSVSLRGGVSTPLAGVKRKLTKKCRTATNLCQFSRLLGKWSYGAAGKLLPRRRL
jgi:hypothetical protein